MPHLARSSNLHMKSRCRQGCRYRNVIKGRTSQSRRSSWAGPMHGWTGRGLPYMAAGSARTPNRPRRSRTPSAFKGLEAPDAVVGAAIPRRPIWDSYKDAAGAVSKTYAASGSYSATKSQKRLFCRAVESHLPERANGIRRRRCLSQGASHDGLHHAGHRFLLFRIVGGLHRRLRSALKGIAMIFDYALAGLVTAGLLFYLTYALLRPERF